MESDNEFASLDSKRKKIQYINDFKTGKTKVVEKSVNNLSRSVNSYFENRPLESFSAVIHANTNCSEGQAKAADINDHKLVDTPANILGQNERKTNPDVNGIPEVHKRGSQQNVEQKSLKLKSATDSLPTTLIDDESIGERTQFGKEADTNGHFGEHYNTASNMTSIASKTTINGSIESEKLSLGSVKNKVPEFDDEDDRTSAEYQIPENSRETTEHILKPTSTKNELVKADVGSNNLQEKNQTEFLVEKNPGTIENDHQQGQREISFQDQDQNDSSVVNILQDSYKTAAKEPDVMEEINGRGSIHSNNQESEVLLQSIEAKAEDIQAGIQPIYHYRSDEELKAMDRDTDRHYDSINERQDNSCIELRSESRDCSTQTHFSYKSFQEMYSVLCEKCGHQTDMKEILLSLMNYPLMLQSGHLYTQLEETILVEENVDILTNGVDNSLPEKRTECDHHLKQSWGETHDELTNPENGRPQQVFDHVVRSADTLFETEGQSELNSTNHDDEDSKNMDCIDPNFNDLQQNESEPNQTEISFRITFNTSNVRSDIPDTAVPFTEQLLPSTGGETRKTFPEQISIDEQCLQGFNEQCESFTTKDMRNDKYNSQHSSSTAEDIYSVSATLDENTIDLVSEVNGSAVGGVENSELTEQEELTENSRKVLPPRNAAGVSSRSLNVKSSFTSTYNPHYIKSTTYPSWNTARRSSGSVRKYQRRSYKGRRDMMDKLSCFAEDNSLEVHNVSADGNCMFSAVVDQLWINGNFRFTPDILRKEAVAFLRRNPTHRDGSHLESFLTTESWEDYLHRMEKNGEWGDHMVLQGVAEVTLTRILVINSEIVRTELKPWHSTTDTSKLDTILLGHMGEYHYVSLRPFNWLDTWAIRAKLKYMDELSSAKPLKETRRDDQTDHSIQGTCDVQQQTEECDKTSPEAQEDGVTKDKTAEDTKKDEESTKNDSDEEFDLSYIAFENTDLVEKAKDFKATEGLFDSKEELDRIVSDNTYIDPVSAVPVGHLSFYLRQLLAPKDVYIHPFATNFRSQMGSPDTLLYGSVGEGLLVHCHSHGFCGTAIHPELLYYRADLAEIVYHRDTATEAHCLLVDMNSCLPGYLRLQVLNRQHFDSCDLIAIDDKVYLERLSFTFFWNGKNQNVHPRIKQGLQCPTWPQSLTSEWQTRERPSGWPDSETLDELSSRPCHIRKCSHVSSQNPKVEWQFIFPDVEKDLLLYYMDENMKYVLRYFKMMVEFHTPPSTRRLQTNHLKTVMLYSCEQLPLNVWSENPGGAILFLVSTLMRHLHKRSLPHYIMNSVNLFDGYSDTEMDALLRDLEHIRLFPLMAVNVFAESNNLPNQWIIQLIVNDIHRYRCDQDHLKSVEQAFCPILIELAKRLVMGGIHYFWKGYKMIERAYMMTSDLEEKRQTENPQTFEQFVEPFVYCVEDPIQRYFFTDFVDQKRGTHTLSKMTISDHARTVGEVAEIEEAGHYNGFPIPDGNKLDDVEYLDSFAEYLVTIHKLEPAAHFLRCGINLGREGLKTEPIDVSEITEEDVKRQVADKNMKTIQNFNDVLYSLYNRLFDVYKKMNQTMLFQEFIHDFEELVIIFNHPCYYKNLANIWHDLGNMEKVNYFDNRSEECRQNAMSTSV